MRLIDAEKDIAKLQEMLDVLIDEGDKTAVRFALNTLNDAGTVKDAVEVVRCKDCDNFQTDWETAFANGRHYCAIMDSIMPPDGFCSYGERKTDDSQMQSDKIRQK